MFHTKSDEFLKGVAGCYKLFLCFVECPDRLTSLLVFRHESIEWPKVRIGGEAVIDGWTRHHEVCIIRASVITDHSAKTVAFCNESIFLMCGLVVLFFELVPLLQDGFDFVRGFALRPVSDMLSGSLNDAYFVVFETLSQFCRCYLPSDDFTDTSREALQVW